VMIANASLGRWPLTAGVATVTPGGKYILANSWPQPKVSGGGGGGFSSLTASQAAPEVPKSSAGARSIWPNLP
jgi:hypothetical protein